MPRLQVALKAPVSRDVQPGDFAVEATFSNLSPEPTRLNTLQASHPSVVLEVIYSRDQRVLLPAPSAPDEKELGPGETIAPGRSVAVRYAGFLDRSLEPGTYRVRYSSPYPALGGMQDDPLLSDWLEFGVRKAAEVSPAAEPLATLTRAGEVITLKATWLSSFFHWILCAIRWLLRRRCNRVLTRDVDEQRTETISNAPPGAEAWNGTYSWRARFNVRVDQAACRVTATVRVRLNGNITQAQRDAWEAAVENAWNNQFKLCCRCCCCRNGYAIGADIQFVNNGEHQVVTVGDSTTNMGNWGRNDTVDVRHEFGHMLGALDEYFTVNGVNYGAGRQPGGSIMNNPANAPAARHCDLIRAAVQQLLATGCNTVPANQPC